MTEVQPYLGWTAGQTTIMAGDGEGNIAPYSITPYISTQGYNTNDYELGGVQVTNQEGVAWMLIYLGQMFATTFQSTDDSVAGPPALVTGSGIYGVRNTLAGLA
jgi:hypothetical protein